MGRLTTRALYIATPLAFAAHPAVAKSGVVDAPVLVGVAATPATLRIGQARPDVPARSYVIVDVPVAHRGVGQRSLGMVIDAEVKRRVANPLSGVGAALTFDDGGYGADDTDLAGEDGNGNGNGSGGGNGNGGGGDVRRSGGFAAAPRSLDAAVLAVHVQRIGFLKARLDDVRAAGSDARTLADLKARLQRAEAARRLAMARGNIALLATPGCRGADACERQRGAVADVIVRGISTERHARPAYRLLRSRAVAASPRLLLLSRGTITGGAPIRLALGHVGSTIALAAQGSAEHMRPGTRSRATHTPDRAGHGLADARRSLARARAALTDDTARERFTIKTAGLLHFPGSESWSLGEAGGRIA